MKPKKYKLLQYLLSKLLAFIEDAKTSTIERLARAFGWWECEHCNKYHSKRTMRYSMCAAGGQELYVFCSLGVTAIHFHDSNSPMVRFAHGNTAWLTLNGPDIYEIMQGIDRSYKPTGGDILHDISRDTTI